MTTSNFLQPAGYDRLQSLLAKIDSGQFVPLQNSRYAMTAPQQPWIIFGCSDGIGLQTTLAAIKSGLLKYALGVYWEPPHLLELAADGTPVSPVHHARKENVDALKVIAEEHGALFVPLYANCIMAPQRGLKGEIKSPANPLDPSILEAFENIREKAPLKDAILINSVAFGKWMCPREGIDPIEIPSVNFDGEIVMTKTKPFHRRGYEETLDTMGRNHKMLLEVALTNGWLGGDSLTAFYTWAGGSQNIDVLRGIYGYGSLGDAKAIAEADTAAFRLEHGLTYGSHAIVRLPAFLSAALMGIPGGGLFGLISRHYLIQQRCFFDMPALATKTVRRLFGVEWVRDNPISQIELDMQETLHIEQISKKVAAVNAAIFKYLEESGHDPAMPIPLEKSRELLAPFIGKNYNKILARFRPNESQPDELDEEDIGEIELHAVLNDTMESSLLTPTHSIESAQSVKLTQFTPSSSHDSFVSLCEGGDIRPDIPLFVTLRHLQKAGNLVDFERFTAVGEDLVVNGYLTDVELSTSFSVQQKRDHIIVLQSILNDRGEEVAHGSLLFGPRPLLRVDEDLGVPMGHPMPIRTPLESTYGTEFTGKEYENAALLKFVADQIRSAGGLLDDIGSLRLSARFGASVKVGQTLQTYAKINDHSLIITILGDQKMPVLRVELRQ